MSPNPRFAPYIGFNVGFVTECTECLYSILE